MFLSDFLSCSFPQSLNQVSLRRFFPPSLRSRSLSSFFPPSLRSGALFSFFFSVSVSVSFFSFFDRILLTIFRFKVWLGLHFKEALATYLVCNLLLNNALQKVPVSRAQTNPTPSHTHIPCHQFTPSIPLPGFLTQVFLSIPSFRCLIQFLPSIPSFRFLIQFLLFGFCVRFLL